MKHQNMEIPSHLVDRYNELSRELITASEDLQKAQEWYTRAQLTHIALCESFSDEIPEHYQPLTKDFEKARENLQIVSKNYLRLITERTTFTQSL